MLLQVVLILQTVLPGATPEDEPSSPIAAQMTYAFNRFWSLMVALPGIPIFGKLIMLTCFFNIDPMTVF